MLAGRWKGLGLDFTEYFVLWNFVVFGRYSSTYDGILSTQTNHDYHVKCSDQWRIQSWSQGFFSKTRTFKWLVKVGASIYQTPDLKKKLGLGGGGFPGNQKKTWIRHW